MHASRVLAGTHDVLQHLSLQSIYTLGLGFHVLAKPNTTLNLLGGLNYTRETYGSEAVVPGVPPGTRLTRDLAAATVGDDFVRRFGPSVTLNEHFEFYPDFSDPGQYRFALDSSAATKVRKWVAWQITVSDRFVSDPPALGTKRNDFILSTGLNFTFAH